MANNMQIESKIDPKIQDAINQTTEPSDLIPFLYIIEFNKIKEFIQIEISKQSKEEQTINKFKLLSIDMISDGPLSLIFEYVLSFPQRHHIKLVCKRWRNLIKIMKIEEQYMKNIHPYTNEIWICDSRRINTAKDKRNEMEKDNLKIKAVKNNLKNIIDSDEFDEGDVILVHPGALEIELTGENYSYDSSNTDPVLQISKSCTILGENQTNGKPVKLYGIIAGEYLIDYVERGFMTIGNIAGWSCNVTIKNLHFMSGILQCIYIYPGATVTISNCIIDADRFGIEHYGDKLIVDNCIITAGGPSVQIGYHAKSVSITNSTLIDTKCHYASSCIKFVKHKGLHRKTQFVELECVNNIFVSDKYPIIIVHDQYGVYDQHNYQSKIPLKISTDNRWFGWNGWSQHNENTCKEKGEVCDQIHVVTK